MQLIINMGKKQIVTVNNTVTFSKWIKEVELNDDLNMVIDALCQIHFTPEYFKDFHDLNTLKKHLYDKRGLVINIIRK